jgi:biotin operon repressor
MSKKQRILQLLLDGKPHSKEELIPITHRFSAAVESLRKDDGYDIETVRVGHNVYVYQMALAKSA